LDELRDLYERTHNVRWLLEVHLVSAVLEVGDGHHDAAREVLEEAIRLGQPGGFVQAFVDVGVPIEELLKTIEVDGEAALLCRAAQGSIPEG